MSQLPGKLCVGCARQACRLRVTAGGEAKRLYAKEWKRGTHHSDEHPGKGTLGPSVYSGSFVVDRQARPRARIAQDPSVRRLAEVSEAAALRREHVRDARRSSSQGPLAKYNDRVQTGELRDDLHQRGLFTINA
jgi:hypothetical protein